MKLQGHTYLLPTLQLQLLKLHYGWETSIQGFVQWMTEMNNAVIYLVSDLRDRWDDSYQRSKESNQCYNSLFLNCQLKLPIMKAPGLREDNGDFVEIPLPGVASCRVRYAEVYRALQRSKTYKLRPCFTT